MWTRRQFLGTSGIAAVSSAVPAAAKSMPAAPVSPVEAAHGVLARQLGGDSGSFHLSLLPMSTAGYPEYEIEASGGEVRIAGTHAVALCRAAYSYLREQCGAMITWSGSHVELPSPLPPLARTHVVCPYKHVQYYNPCTYGYTLAFWDWPRWERELDWMALHGITMPLAMGGQEWVWQQVWRSFGLRPAEVDAFFTGPAHLPWHWMGNINGFDGPLPQHWIEEHRLLQRQILDRMRALGMTPVAPAFAGFVPQGFLRVRPDAEIFTLLWLPQAFATIPRSTRTFLLHPAQEELYREIGRRFIQLYAAEYGPVDYYLADTFNELAVPVSAEHRYDDLERFGRTVYAGIKAGNANATWVMQGWLFVDDPFWDAASVEALLRGVPDDRMLLLDYSNDLAPNLRESSGPGPWKRDHAFFGKPWAVGMAHTFGGNNNVKGNLARMASEPAATLAHPERGNLVGWCMCPEGIETNEVVYELMTDAAWQPAPIDLLAWVPAYTRARYGPCPPATETAMAESWRLLQQSAYSAHVWKTKQAWQGEPTLTPAAVSVDAGPEFVRATELFLACADALGEQPLYRNDLIEFVSQAAGGWVDAQLTLATEAIRSKELATARLHADAALAMMLQIDALMHLRPDRRLETWVDAARARAGAPDEAAAYDRNARLLITTWGWPELSDYASRVWSGLARDYYAARWRAFFAHHLDEGNGAAFSLDIWQQSWLSRPYTPSAPMPVADLLAAAHGMMATCRGEQAALFATRKPPQENA